MTRGAPRPYLAPMTPRLINGEDAPGVMLLARAILATVAVFLLVAAATEAPLIDPAALLADLVRIFMSF